MDVFKVSKSYCLRIAIQTYCCQLAHRLYKSKITTMLPTIIRSLCTISKRVACAAKTSHRLHIAIATLIPLVQVLLIINLPTSTIITIITITLTVATITSTAVVIITQLAIVLVITMLAFVRQQQIRQIVPLEVYARRLHLWILNRRPKHIRQNINLMIVYWLPNTMSHRQYHRHLVKIHRHQFLV